MKTSQREKLAEIYISVCINEGKIVKMREFLGASKLRSIHKFQRETGFQTFSSFQNFCAKKSPELRDLAGKLGENIELAYFTDEEMVEEYVRVSKKVARFATEADFETFSLLASREIRNRFGAIGFLKKRALEKHPNFDKELAKANVEKEIIERAGEEAYLKLVLEHCLEIGRRVEVKTLRKIAKSIDFEPSYKISSYTVYLRLQNAYPEEYKTLKPATTAGNKRAYTQDFLARKYIEACLNDNKIIVIDAGNEFTKRVGFSSSQIYTKFQGGQSTFRNYCANLDPDFAKLLEKHLNEK